MLGFFVVLPLTLGFELFEDDGFGAFGRSRASGFDGTSGSLIDSGSLGASGSSGTSGSFGTSGCLTEITVSGFETSSVSVRSIVLKLPTGFGSSGTDSCCNSSVGEFKIELLDKSPK